MDARLRGHERELLSSFDADASRAS